MEYNAKALELPQSCTKTLIYMLAQDATTIILYEYPKPSFFQHMVLTVYMRSYVYYAMSIKMETHGDHYYVHPRPLVTKRMEAKSCEVLMPWDFGLDFYNHSEIWQTPLQQCCQDVCQNSEWYDHYNIQCRGFKTLRDLTVRHPSV